MQLGRICDINLATAATLTGGLLSLDNLKTEDRYVVAPAIIEDVTDLAASQFTTTLPAARPISLIGVLFHTLSLTAEYRLTLYDGEGAPTSVGAWTPVFGRRNPSRSMPWWRTNWWSGRPSLEEINLLPRHLWVTFPMQRVGAFKLEFDDHLNEDGFAHLGGLWATTGVTTRINFERGRELDLVPRGQIDMAPSGRRFAEDLQPYRTLAVRWEALDKAEAYRLFDLGLRVRNTKTVLFLPDLDDPVSMAREAFPAVLQRPPKPRFTYDTWNQVALTLEEILA